ncbi:IniB N-terminal domain-containing protein [Mycobacterium sp. B14F4]|uniref:IniB N-terminal domain-containing protein n=1 Tax=Mycobacterium sp. B14F4 TaxID=3153565 RepID=UPI00325D76A5
MSVGMSILDYTTGLFREPASLRAFVDDPRQALCDAGFPDATPEQVHDLLPVIAESMPPDHPLQAVVHADDLAAALQALDVDDLVADAHDHHRDVALIEKAMGGPEGVVAVPPARCAASEEAPMIVVDTDPAERGRVGSDKALDEVPDDPFTSPTDETPSDDVPGPDGEEDTVAELIVRPDFDAVVWGKALE